MGKGGGGEDESRLEIVEQCMGSHGGSEEPDRRRTRASCLRERVWVVLFGNDGVGAVDGAPELSIGRPCAT
jgi:hypothetical protein